MVVPEPGYNWRQLNLLNEKYYLLHKDLPLDEVLVNFHSSFRQILQAMEGIPEDEMLTLGFYSWTGKYPLIVYLAGNTCEHYRWANQVIHPRSVRRRAAASI